MPREYLFSPFPLFFSVGFAIHRRKTASREKVCKEKDGECARVKEREKEGMLQGNFTGRAASI